MRAATGPTAESGLVVRLSVRRSAVGPLLMLPLFLLALSGAVTTYGEDRALMVSGALLFGAFLFNGLWHVVRAVRDTWQLRVCEDGVAVRGARVVSWTQLAEVRIDRMRPRRWDLSGLLMRLFRVVVFVPRPGVELPLLPAAAGYGRFGRRMTTRLYGSPLVVATSGVNVSAHQVAEAVERYSDVPVHWR